MSDPCPTCGHVTEPGPADWLSTDELALVAFLTARVIEHRDTVEGYTSGAARDVAIVAVDLAASVRGVLVGFSQTRDPERRAPLWNVLLVLSQPWQEHPDYRPEWLTAIADLLDRQEN